MFQLEPDQKIRGSALFSRDKTMRLQIRRWWSQEPISWVGWLMLNPSTAAENHNDPTALRVTHFTKSWGYGGWIGINLYPLIASDPRIMWRWSHWDKNGPDWYARDALQENLTEIDRVSRIISLRVVAFGMQPVKRDGGWLEQCLEAFGQPSSLSDVDERFYCLGTNKDGQPLHPLARGKLRVSDDTKPIVWMEK
jgi:hypothetical protein